MSDDRRDQESQDIVKLKVMVSRLHSLAITNLQTVINLNSAFLMLPNLPDGAEFEAREALSCIQKQIDLLTELAEISEPNNGR
jgi:hypothetical protein